MQACTLYGWQKAYEQSIVLTLKMYLWQKRSDNRNSHGSKYNIKE